MAEIDERLKNMKANGSEPGGGSGAESIEEHAGVASGEPTTTEQHVEELAESDETAG